MKVLFVALGVWIGFSSMAQAQDITRRILGTWQWVSVYCEDMNAEMNEETSESLWAQISAGITNEFLVDEQLRTHNGPIGCQLSGSCESSRDMTYTIEGNQLTVTPSEQGESQGVPVSGEMFTGNTPATVESTYEIEVNGDQLLFYRLDNSCGGDSRVVDVYLLIAEPTQWN